MENTRKYQDNYPYLLVNIKTFSVKELESSAYYEQEVVINETLPLFIHSSLISLIHVGWFKFWYEIEFSEIHVVMFEPQREIPNP